MVVEYLSLPRGMARMPLTHKNVAFYAALVRGYVTGEIPGAVVISPGVGFHVAGGMSPEGAVDYWPETAVGWGTYVRTEFRQQGYARRLRALGAKRLTELGFRASIGEAHVQNRDGLASLRWTEPGSRWVGITYEFDLEAMKKGS